MRKTAYSTCVETVKVSHFKIPTDSPESDGTYKWDYTNLCVATLHSGKHQAIGYTYAGSETAALINDVLADVIKANNPMAPEAAHMAMWERIRNIGRPGVCSMAISASRRCSRSIC